MDQRIEKVEKGELLSHFDAVEEEELIGQYCQLEVCGINPVDGRQRLRQCRRIGIIAANAIDEMVHLGPFVAD
mgnify:CR=1 FL=1